jgi:hypothetical protein
MRQVASAAAPRHPPAIASLAGSDKAAMLSVRMTEATLEALAAHALGKGTTQRRVIAEALAKHGVNVAARDLEERPLPRRRGVR